MITLKLKHPITAGELTVEELKIKRPTLKDFVAVGEHTADTGAALVAITSALCGLPESVIEKIDIEDAFLLRITIARIWDTYFWTGEYNENPQEEAANTSP